MRHSTTPPGPTNEGIGASPFNQTQWSVVLAAAGRRDPQDVAASLEKLCHLYWRPIYAFIRSQGQSPHDAQDLTQEFFLRLLKREFLNSVDQSKGRFRSFLLASLKNFLSNERARANALKRGGGIAPLALDFTEEDAHYVFQPSDGVTPETLYERRWATTILECTLARLREEYVSQGKENLFENLKTTLTEGRGTVAYSALATRLSLSEAAIKMAVHRLRKRYRDCLRDEIAQTVSNPEEVEDELRQVMGAFAR